MELTEELASMKKRIMKSRRMEAPKGGEVRRVHIIYFLSRMGRIEHPHLIRVHHLSRNGVYLRDVKRWLADLRGKDMPESFAWSYKRRYKAGYVWQDLLDDDLITPISDNEYVLKGSEISSIPFDPCSLGETIQKQQPVEVEDKRHQPNSTEEAIDQGHQDSEMHIPTKTISSEINEEASPPFGSETSSTLTDDSMKLEEEKDVETISSKQKLDEQSENLDNYFSNLLDKKSKKKKSSGTPAGSSFSSRPTSFTRSRSRSSAASHMFRNLITCGAVDTKDSVMVVMNRSNKTCSNKSTTPTNNPDNKSEICKGDKLGGSARIFGTSWNHQQQHHQQHSARKSCDGVRSSSEFANQKVVSAAYKPVAGPNCSQCGKSFKPEKMHTHMKSCRGMKALAKSAAAAAAVEKTPSQRSMNSSNKEPASGYFLTH